jgi:SH3-like domain-containing protein
MWLRYCSFSLLLLAGWTTVPQGTGPGPGIGQVTKLPVPRFVSLRTNEVNFRAGPGFQYPVSWVYQRDGLPVEIIGEFDVWRQVLAPDGGTGWVHMATIRARRTFFITAQQAVLRRGADPDAAPVAYLQSGVTGTLIACNPPSDFWGAFPGETVK